MSSRWLVALALTLAGTPPRCQECHQGDSTTKATPTAPRWGVEGFDHRERAGFALIGRHGAIGSRACHRGDAPAAFERLGRGEACAGCHAHRQVHDAKFSSKECTQCHFPPGT